MNVIYTGTREPDDPPDELEIWFMPMLQPEPLRIDQDRLELLTREPTGIVIYSRNAVRALRKTGAARVLAPFDRHTWWAVGDQTASRLHREFGVGARFPSRQNFEGLKLELSEAELPASVVAFSLQGTERDLEPVLNDRGIQFTDVPVYRTVRVEYEAPDRRVRGADWIVFTSPKGVRAFLDLEPVEALREELDELSIATIGPKTAAALEENAIEADLVPDVPSRDALLQAISTTAESD